MVYLFPVVKIESPSMSAGGRMGTSDANSRHKCAARLKCPRASVSRKNLGVQVHVHSRHELKKFDGRI